MKFKKEIFVGFVFLTVFFCGRVLGAQEGLFEVTVRARGATLEEALNGAIDEAIRKSLGSVFAERSQADGDMLEEKLIQYSRGTAANHKILETTQGEDGVTLTVLVTVDPQKIKENVRVLKEGNGSSGVAQWESPLLQAGQKALTQFFKNFRYERFLEVRLNEKQIDTRKGALSVAVSLRFDQERYFQEFALPLTKAMGEIFASPGLARELEGEYDAPLDRMASTLSLLGPNLTSGTWVLPRVFHDTLLREARFWDAGKGKINTHKRIWLHFSLLDAQGREIERLPIHLGATNVVFFSETRKDSASPWIFSGTVEGEQKSNATLWAAPRFGVSTGTGYAFYDSYIQLFLFQLDGKLLARVHDVKVSLELER